MGCTSQCVLFLHEIERQIQRCRNRFAVSELNFIDRERELERFGFEVIDTVAVGRDRNRDRQAVRFGIPHGNIQHLGFQRHPHDRLILIDRCRIRYGVADRTDRFDDTVNYCVGAGLSQNGRNQAANREILELDGVFRNGRFQFRACRLFALAALLGLRLDDLHRSRIRTHNDRCIGTGRRRGLVIVIITCYHPTAGSGEKRGTIQFFKNDLFILKIKCVKVKLLRKSITLSNDKNSGIGYPTGCNSTEVRKSTSELRKANAKQAGKVQNASVIFM